MYGGLLGGFAGFLGSFIIHCFADSDPNKYYNYDEKKNN